MTPSVANTRRPTPATVVRRCSRPGCRNQLPLEQPGAGVCRLA